MVSSLEHRAPSVESYGTSTATEDSRWDDDGTFTWTGALINACFSDEYATLSDQAILDQLTAAADRKLQFSAVADELARTNAHGSPSNRKEQYQQVIALIVCFNTLAQPPDQGPKIVADAFTSYNYFVMLYQLPVVVPTDDFAMKLRILQEHTGHDALLIIYISGHGDLLDVPAGSLRFTG